MKFGRVVAALGLSLGWLVWVLLFLLSIFRAPRLHLILGMVSVCCMVMAVGSTLLFVGLGGEICIDDKCTPRAVLAAIPASAFYVATAVILLCYRNSSQSRPTYVAKEAPVAQLVLPLGR
jgi:hypothetical protein